MDIWALCSWVGLLSLVSLVYRVASFVSPYLRPSRLDRYLPDKDGSPPWALVTGASDGIGRHFCHQLAARYFPHALQQAAMDLAPAWAHDKSILDVIKDRWRQDQEMMARAKAKSP